MVTPAGGAPCAACESRRFVWSAASGAFVRCWPCRKQIGRVYLGVSGRWTAERHEAIKDEATTLP